MLSFSSGLTNGLYAKNINTFWVLKLYYNAGSSNLFYGFSDANRDDGDDFYYGLITDFGQFVQNIDFFDYTSSISNMTIKLANVPNSINGGRFSDLLSTLNFGNRKWELFQCKQEVRPWDTSSNLLAEGVIAGDFTYNRNEVVLQLLDKTGEIHKDLPTNTVTSTDAPEENIGKPVPMQYGDFSEKAINNIPSNFSKIYPRAYFPAIIADRWDDTVNVVVAVCDSQRMHTVDSDLVFQYQKNIYPNLASVAFSTSGSSDIIRFSGASNIYYPKLKNGGTLIDESFSTGTSLSASAGGTGVFQFDIPPQPNLGTITDINLIFSVNLFTGSSPDAFTFRDANNQTHLVNLTFNNSNKEQSVNIPLAVSGGVNPIFSVTEQEDWSFQGTYEFFLDAGSEDVAVQFKEIALEITYTSDQDYTQIYENINQVSCVLSYGILGDRRVIIPRQVIKKKKEITSPALIEYVYFSGKGRKFGSWTQDSSRSNGYSTNDLIENPIYIVEDIIRTELGSTAVDITTFDSAGHASTGKIKNVFDEDDTTDIKFAFSQHKFINSKDLIENIGSLCGSYFFLSQGKTFKCAVLEKDADYASGDAVENIDYNLITLDSIALTPLNAVRNSIVVDYDYDYAKSQTKKSVSTSDSTSQGTTVSGVSQTLKMELEADKILDTTTATALANYYKDISKDRKLVIMFDVPTARYNHLEVGDIINFENWDSNIKLYGTAMTTSFLFMITQTTKRPNGCEFVVTEVGRP